MSIIQKQKLKDGQDSVRQSVEQSKLDENNTLKPKLDDLSSYQNNSNQSQEECKSDAKSFRQQISGELSSNSLIRFKQQVYLLFNDYESSKLAILLSLISIQIVLTDILFLIIETEQGIGLKKDIWINVNFGVSSYFFLEYLLRAFSYNAFDETFKEFITKPFNTIDLSALLYSIIEIILYLLSYDIDDKIKILRMFIVLRLVRMFKYSTFSKGINILIRGLSESLQALSLLLFFTMICVVLIASFMYFAEKEFVDDSQIQNIPEAIWWAIITITTVGYGDYVPKSILGKFIGALSLIFGVLLLSLPVAIIGNKFQEIYLQNKREETEKSRKKAKQHYNQSQNQNEKEIYRIILKLNELEEVNERIEKCLKDNQFLYRSISRDAQNMIDKIEMNKEAKKQQKVQASIEERVIKLKEDIKNKRKYK